MTLSDEAVERATDAFMARITVDGNGGIEFLEEGVIAAIEASGLVEQIKALEDRLATARGGLIAVAARLAAALSLLERGGKAAKKAAPSDKMFDQMLKDYMASLARARTDLVALDAIKEKK